MKTILIMIIALAFFSCDYDGTNNEDIYNKLALVNFYHETHPYYCDGDIIMKWADDHYTPVKDCGDRGQTCVLHDPNSISCEDK